MWTVGRCIVYTEIRLLLHIHPFISSFFFPSNFQTLKFFVTLFSGTVKPRRLKLGTHMDSGQMYRVYQNHMLLLFVPSFFIFLQFSFQFSNIKNFCRTFLRNCEAYKVDTWYTHGQWVDVLCIPQSGCCFLFVLYFFLSSVQKFKIFITLFSRTMRPKMFKLGTLIDNGWLYPVYYNRAAVSYLSLYFFIFLSL